MNLICGINPVLEALEAGERHFDRLLVVKGLRNRRVSDAVSRASQMGIPLRFETRETLDRMAGAVPHQGIVAIVSAKPALTLEAILDHAHDPALLVVLDGVEDPRNLGAVLRTAEAAGADGVVLPQRHSAGLSETVNRASAGALEHVRAARVGNLVQALETLKARGLWVIGFDAGGTERWDTVDLRRPIALVLGGEGRGMRRLVREHCDHLVSLPMFGQVGSLNVSVAAGIALYEAVRQRGAVPSHVRPIPLRPAPGPHVVSQGDRPDHWQRPPLEAAPSHEDGDEGPNVLLHEEEEPWWGTAAVSGEDAGRRERHRGAPRRARAAPTAPATPAGAPAGAPADGGGGGGRRRHRRRKGRRGGREPGETATAQAPDARPLPPPGEAGQAPEPGRPPGRRRFRRRRRR